MHEEILNEDKQIYRGADHPLPGRRLPSNLPRGAILRQAEGGVPVAELCREHGMSNASFYKWRAKYGGMDASLISQMKAMEDENRRLKRMYADLSMQADLLKEALGKK